MYRWTGLYLHGFLSSGNSEKGQWFLNQVQQQLKDDQAVKSEQDALLHNKVTWHTFEPMTYPMAQVHSSVQAIETKLLELQKNASSVDVNLFIMGSSMGGFYAQYFGQKYQIPYIMINPALNIDELFQEHLDSYLNPNTDENILVDKAYTNELAKYRVDQPDYEIPALLLVDKDDEVIDVDYCLQHYSEDKLSHPASKQKVYSGGDHRFIHLDSAWQELQEFLIRIDSKNS